MNNTASIAAAGGSGNLKSESTTKLADVSDVDSAGTASPPRPGHALGLKTQKITKHEKPLRPFNQKEIKILLLENINESAIDAFGKQGYQVETHSKALPEDLLIQKIEHVHAIGIRSKTQLTEKVLRHAKNLLVIGCFCIGTNQVDLDYAASRGIAVFNSPFSNSRSVAEMTIANIVNLARQIGDRSAEVHRGCWAKVSKGCYEVRGKKLGIVGYGHIGSQLSVLAEAMGMNVVFFDILQIMPIGRAQPMDSLKDLLKEADFVTLHVPATPDTRDMIGKEELEVMKKGSYLINASRGNVVVIPALVDALKAGHLAGCAIDVYPQEPASNSDGFQSPLQGCPNTILTPHIGGSTEEAQSAIGVEVSTALSRYVNTGTTLGAVNFPENDLRASVPESKTARICNIHHNVPGVLKEINRCLANFNIEKQICDSKGSIAYMMADVNTDKEEDLKEIYNSLNGLKENVLTRILY
ncbi:hypothetical protein MP638_002249 [Amoeboaphelidium occidentale]|nr:hypothetical protein MP638_002249 [Amoeboaphelidium occidentale]